MKKTVGAPVPVPVPEPVAPVEQPDLTKHLPQSGCGTFEYINGTIYSGNWKLLNGVKVKHGHGKIIFPSSSSGGSGSAGAIDASG